MTRARAILLGSAASIFFAALTPALALTPDQRVFLFGSPFVPMWQCILTTGVLCPGITVNSPSLGGLVADATGALTYKPNNLLTYSNTFSNAAWTFYNINTPVDNSAVGPSGASTAATVTLSGSGLRQIALKQVLPTHAYNRILTFNVKIGSGVRYFQILTDGVSTSYANFDLQAGTVGTSGATASNPMITPLGNGWYQISLVDTSQISTVIYCYTVDTINAIWSASSAAAAGSTYYVTSATASAVTYETSPRPQDQVITTASAYYGPAFDYQQGLRIWEQRVNYFLNSATGGTQNVTTTATPYTLSCWGTGTITLTGTSTAGPLTCSGATPTSSVTPTSLTFTPTAGSLTLTVAGSATYVNLEQATFPGPRILTGTAAVTASADSVTLTGTPVSVMETANFTAIVQATTRSGNSRIIGNGAKTVSNTDVTFHGQNWQGGAMLTTSNATSANTVFRIGSSFSSTGRSVVLNGGVVATDASSTYATGQTYYLGSNIASSSFLDGYIQSGAVYNRRFPDSTLQSKSTVGAPY